MTSDIGTAEALIERHGIVELPVDPFLIADREGIAVGAMPESSDGWRVRHADARWNPARHPLPDAHRQRMGSGGFCIAS